MFVYCEVEDCKHNKDGMCECVWPVGTKAIKISESWNGIPFCTDYAQREEQEEEEC